MEAKSGGMRKKQKERKKTKQKTSESNQWARNGTQRHTKDKKKKTVSMKISVACVGLRWRVRLVSFRFFYSIAILLFFVFFLLQLVFS